MTPTDILKAVKNRRLFGLIPRLRSLETWTYWIVLLKAIFGLPMEPSELVIFQQCTGRKAPPPTGARETFIVVGRRGGKSFMAALKLVFVAAFGEFRQYVTVGESLAAVCLAKDKSQARIVFKYARAIIQAVPALKALVVDERADEIELSNGVTILVKAADVGGIRGLTCVFSENDEIAFWQSQGVNPDNEVLNAIRPSMVTIPNAKMICTSTGYAESGVLYDAFKRYYGKDDPNILVWQATSLQMNPTLDPEFIANEIERDPDANRAEWRGEFRADISACFSLDSIEAAIIPGRGREMPNPRVSYSAFTDLSGGRGDAYTMAIGHRHGEVAVIDSLLILPFVVSPKEVVREFSTELKAFGLTTVCGDNYGGEWPVSEFSSKPNCITYQRADKNKSELYLELIPAMNSRKVWLPDVEQLKTELRKLERRRGKSGKDSVDHPSNGHDDAANSVAGCVSILLAEPEEIDFATIAKLNEMFPDRVVRPDLSWEDQIGFPSTHDYGLPSPRIDISKFGGFR